LSWPASAFRAIEAEFQAIAARFADSDSEIAVKRD